jgi:hypothetical protein
MMGRERALAELSSARAEGKIGFLAVLDADFDRADGVLQIRPDVVWTDLHDLEVLLIASPAFEKVLTEVASRDKLSTFEATEGHTLREAVVLRATDLARLRWLSRRDGLGLTFRKHRADGGKLDRIKYQDFCKAQDWSVSRDAMVRAALNFSSRHDLDVSDLIARMDCLPKDVDIWQLLVGHDLVALITIGLRRRFGSKNLSVEEVEERLRLAFEREHLHKTSMYSEIMAWEGRNKPYRVFGPP